MRVVGVDVAVQVARLPGVLEVAGLGDPTNYELPITQEQLADAVALTPVHVNRTLMKLEGEGLITRTKRMISIVDWQKLVKVADFDPRYLHLDRRSIERAEAVSRPAMGEAQEAPGP